MSSKRFLYELALTIFQLPAGSWFCVSIELKFYSFVHFLMNRLDYSDHKPPATKETAQWFSPKSTKSQKRAQPAMLSWTRLPSCCEAKPILCCLMWRRYQSTCGFLLTLYFLHYQKHSIMGILSCKLPWASFLWSKGGIYMFKIVIIIISRLHFTRRNIVNHGLECAKYNVILSLLVWAYETVCLSLLQYPIRPLY